MEYVYAAMLLHKAGKEINEQSITQILSAAGINPDAVRVKALVASLAEVKIDEAVKSAPTIWGSAPAAPAAPAAAAPTAEAKPKEDKKKKEEEEKAKEEAALEGLGSLFG